MPKALAIDIGASGGRHIYAELTDGKLVSREVYRFENNVTKQDGHLIWDIDNLKTQVIKGLAACKEAGLVPDTVAIDTWGVDYVLLDKDDKEILPVYAYRDSRTEPLMAELESKISTDRLYELTGIQRQSYNTIYQLYADKKAGRLDKAERFLMMPEYLSFVLCGKKANEYTEATTSGMLHAESKTWCKEIIDTLGYPEKIFDTPLPPATVLGELTEEVQKKVGFNCKVVLCPSHDTASAVMACPLSDGDAYISSGTWSLMGLEITEPITTISARAANITNEGGIEYRFRFLKNIMGLWMIQSIRRETGKVHSFPEIAQMARESTFEGTVDVADNAFFAPDSMIEAIKDKSGRPDLTLGDVLRCVYHSLAKCYAKTLKELEEITGKPINKIRIIGGGCQDGYLNELTAAYTGRTVTAGPIEATATGNLMSQFMAEDKTMTLAKAREIIYNTFEIREI